jgi:VanZ family protein
MIALMFHKLLSITAWTSLIYIAFATLAPISERPHVAGVHFEHVVAFAILGMLFFLTYPRQIVLVCVIVVGSAVLLEVLQMLTPDRHGRLTDAAEKIAGGAVGIAVGRTVLFFEEAKRWFET